MWTLILIISFNTGYYQPKSAAVAIDHIQGFRTESECVEASRKIARERKDKTLSMYCVRTTQSISP